MSYFIFAGVVITAFVTGLLIAQVSFGILKKNCRIISFQSIIIALINVILWCGIFIAYGISFLLVIYGLVTCALVGLSIVDWCSYEIPIRFNYFIFGMGIIRLLLDLSHWYEYLIGMILVSGIFFVIVLATKGRGMGGGDVKLMFTVGLLLGWKHILLVMVIGSLLGSVIHIIIMKLSKKEHMLAFGPYLSAAAYIVMIFGSQIINWYISYFNNSLK